MFAIVHFCHILREPVTIKFMMASNRAEAEAAFSGYVQKYYGLTTSGEDVSNYNGDTTYCLREVLDGGWYCDPVDWKVYMRKVITAALKGKDWWGYEAYENYLKRHDNPPMIAEVI